MSEKDLIIDESPIEIVEDVQQGDPGPQGAQGAKGDKGDTGPAMTSYATKALMDADLTPGDGEMAYVTNDPTPGNNGAWSKSGGSGAGSWVQASSDRVALVETHQQTAQAARDNLLLPFVSNRIISGSDSGPSSAPSIFTGWASPVTYLGDEFDVVKIGLTISTPGGGWVTAEIRLDDNTTVVASVTRYVAASGDHLFFFKNMLTSADITTPVFYVAVFSQDATVLLRNRINGGGNGDRLPDLNIYRPKYSTSTVGVWVNSSASYINCLTLVAYNTAVDVVDADAMALLLDVPVSVSPLTIVEFSGDTPAYALSSLPPNARALPFMGWGSLFNNTGSWSANMARIPALSRTPAGTAKWETITIEVRDASATGALVATGSVYVDSAVDTLTDIEIPLVDPVSGAEITITNADLGSVYFIGYKARTSAGAPADCGESKGTCAVYEGSSFYCLNEVWAAYAGDSFIAIELTLAADLVARSISVVKTESLPVKTVTAASLDSEIGGQLASSIDVVLPPEIYGVVGHEISVYFENLLRSLHGLRVDAVCSIGTHQAERWTDVPTGQLTTTFDLNVYGAHGEDVLATETSSLIVKAASVGSGVTKKCLFIGDSTTADGVYVSEIASLFGSDVMAVTLLGTRGTGPNYHEGISGWTIDLFNSSASSPFVFSGVFDFAQYLSTNLIVDPDYVFINLGINDVFSLTTDAAVASATAAMAIKLEAMIADIQTAVPAAVVGVAVPIMPAASQDAFGSNYDSGQTQWRYKRNILAWARTVIDSFGGRSAEGIKLVPLNVNIDTVNNFSRAAATPANSRTATTVERQNNGVHPSTEGYGQIADSFYYFIKGQES